MDYLWSSGQAEQETKALEALPDSLKLRLDLALKSQLIKRVPLFKELSPSGLVEIVRRLTSLVAIPGEVIVQEGHEGNEMFFLGSGSVRVYKNVTDLRAMKLGLSEVETIQLACLHAGHFFGEMALIDPAQKIRSASIEAVTFCDMFMLSRQDFEEVAHLLEGIQKKIKRQARLRRADTQKQLNKPETKPGADFEMRRHSSPGILGTFTEATKESDSADDDAQLLIGSMKTHPRSTPRGLIDRNSGLTPRSNRYTAT